MTKPSTLQAEKMGLTGLRPGSGKKEKSHSSKRKLEKKVEFYTKVKDVSIALGAIKTIKKKKLRSRQRKVKVYDLSTLSESLPDLTPKRPKDFKLNCKSRQKLVQKESERLKRVLGDPIFQTDPLGAVRQYIESTQPPPPKNQKKKNDKTKKAKKKKGAKESSFGESSLQAMAM